MNYIDNLKNQIIKISNDRAKYIQKCNKYKQLYYTSLNSVQNQYLNYVFTMDNYTNSLKKLELELNTLEFFYNIYFCPFNIDGWFKKNTEILIKRTLKEILLPYDEVKINNERPFNLSYLRYLRNLVMYNLKNGVIVRFECIHLDEPYIALITKDTIQIYNKFHNENKLYLNETSMEIFNINKHILLQFILNPFWDTELYSEFNYTTNKIINKDDTIIDIPYELYIDSRNPEWLELLLEDYINPYFDNVVIDFDKFTEMIFDLILNYNISIKNELFTLLLDMRKKLLNSDKVVFYNKYNDYTTNKKQIKWSYSVPQVNLESTSYLTSGKRNLFTEEEISLITSKKILKMSPSDLGLVLPSIMENNEKLLNIIPCFLQEEKDILQDNTRKEIILNQIKKMEKTSLYLSSYGLEFIMYLLERQPEENNYNILVSYIWDHRLWKLNYQMTRLSYLNFFDIINNNAEYQWKEIEKLLKIELSIESKIATLIFNFKNKINNMDTCFYFERNPEIMLKMITDKNFNINYNDKLDFVFNKIEVPKLTTEVKATDLFTCYLFNTTNIDKFNFNIKTYLTKNYFLQEILSIFLNCIEEIKRITLFTDDNFSEIKIEVLKYCKVNLFDLITINGKLITPDNLDYIVSINGTCIEYRYTKFYYNTSSENFIYIKTDRLPIEYITSVINFTNKSIKE